MQLASEAASSNRAFWAKHLAGYQTPQQLQAPEDRQPVPSSRIHIHLDAAAVNHLAEEAARSGATLFMVLAAAFAQAILQSLQLSDLIFTATTSLRRIPGLQECIGCLIDSVPFRVTSSQSASSRQNIVEQVCLASRPASAR